VTKAAKAIKEITDTVFEGIYRPAVGQLYHVLCESFPLQEIKTKAQNDSAHKVVERLIDFLNNNDSKSQGVVKDVESYLSVLTDLVEIFERETYPKAKTSSPKEVLSYLMERNELKQLDLAKELGGQSVVSDILSGKRELNTSQIKALANRFKVSPTLFL